MAVYQVKRSDLLPYVNEPSDYAGGLCTFINAKRVPAAGPYETGVGYIHKFPERTGPQQWAVFGSSPNGPTILNIGVQSGSGDTNNLSCTDQLVFHKSENWQLSTEIDVTTTKPHAYFWIPGSAMDKILNIKHIVVGRPLEVKAFVCAHLLNSH